jgi:hypothetical protein
MRLRRPRAKFILLVAVGLTVVGTVAAGLAYGVLAPTATHYEVMPFDATAKYLIYAKAIEKADGKPLRGWIYYRTAHGKPHLLATRTHIATSEAGIAGSMVLYTSDANAADEQTAPEDWRNLSNGAHGSVPQRQTITTATGDAVTAYLAAPAPTGWILESDVPGPDHLYLQKPDGSLTDLGAPEFAGQNSALGDGGFDNLSVGTSSTALVVTSGVTDEKYNNGSATVMHFSQPGVYTRFIAANPRQHTSCGTVTAKYIACDIQSDAAAVKEAVRLYSIEGKQLIATKSNRDPSRAMGSKLAWLGSPDAASVGHELNTVSTSGKVQTVTGTFDKLGPTGLDGLILTRDDVTNPWDREIVLVTSPTHVHVIVHDD